MIIEVSIRRLLLRLFLAAVFLTSTAPPAGASSPGGEPQADSVQVIGQSATDGGDLDTMMGQASAPEQQTHSGPGPPRLDSDAAASLLLKANESYREGRYSEAATFYNRLLDAGMGSGSLHYNLGNALLRSGELGHAVAEYRRALLLSPRDQDVRANLAFARKSAKDAVQPPQAAPWVRTALFWHHVISKAEALRWGVVVAALFWLLIAIGLVRTGLRPPLIVLGAVAIVALALLGSALYRQVNPTVLGVVIPAQADVFSGTDPQSRVIFQLRAGTELAVTRTDEQWTQFRLPDGTRGWLPTEHLDIIDSRSL